MPVDSSMVGSATGAITAEVDERWSMAYAAGLGDALACYLDTRRTAGIIAHPIFPVCFEWPAASELRAKHRASVSAAEAARGVHATQHTVIHRLVKPPERVITTATIAGIERRKPGVYELTRFETVDGDGSPVCTTYNGTIYRQVELIGPDRPAAYVPPAALTAFARPRAELKIPVAAVAAHVYTECARIWNPIHTDTAVAARAGLPGLILHGTATLALSVSRIIREELGSDPERVSEIYGRFGAMVLMPSEITVRILARDKATAAGETIFFETLSQEGGRAVRDGVMRLR